MIALMIALYLAQDSFGTATNVTGDGALATILERMSRKQLAQPNVAEEKANAQTAADAAALAESDVAAAGVDSAPATSDRKKVRTSRNLRKSKKVRQVAPTDSPQESMQ